MPSEPRLEPYEDPRDEIAERYEESELFVQRAFDRVGEVDTGNTDNADIVAAVTSWYANTPHFADDVELIFDGELRP